MYSLFDSYKAMEEEAIELNLNGQKITIPVRRHRRAKRMTLRVKPSEFRIILTIPPSVKQSVAHRFTLANCDWISQQIAKLPQPRPFHDGAIIPFRGHECRIIAIGGRVTTHYIFEDGKAILKVGGEHHHVSRRLTDWMKNHARYVLKDATDSCTNQLGLTYTKLRIGDPSSRWGSCSAKGVISYSWRLILAPPFVLDYVAAHEVAHLLEMNHSMAFWKIVHALNTDVNEARSWLAKNGMNLHMVGMEK